MDAKPELLRALADSLNSYDEAVRNLIRDELETIIRPGLEAARDQAVARLGDAYAALKVPQEQVAETDEAIAYAEKELATYQADMESSSVSVRASARSFVAEWEQELASLRTARAQKSQVLAAFTDEHRAAKDALAKAEMILGGFELNLESPFMGYGRRTAAYQGFRIGSYPMWVTLLGNNTGHPEYDAFYSAIDDIAEATGYDTESLRERLLQKARTETQENFSRDPEPAPSGRDIVDSELLSMEVASINRALDSMPSRIDDYRSPIGALPRNEAVRESLRVPRVPDEMRTH